MPPISGEFALCVEVCWRETRKMSHVVMKLATQLQNRWFSAIRVSNSVTRAGTIYRRNSCPLSMPLLSRLFVLLFIRCLCDPLQLLLILLLLLLFWIDFDSWHLHTHIKDWWIEPQGGERFLSLLCFSRKVGSCGFQQRCSPFYTLPGWKFMGNEESRLNILRLPVDNLLNLLKRRVLFWNITLRSRWKRRGRVEKFKKKKWLFFPLHLRIRTGETERMRIQSSFCFSQCVAQ